MRSRKSKRVNSLSPAAIGIIARGAHFGDAGLVVGRDRLLEPGEVAVAHQMGKALGLGDGEGAVRVDHDLDIGPERGARRLDALGAEPARAPSMAPTRIFTALKPPCFT